MKRFALGFLILSIMSLSIAAQERFVKPVDEASQDASFLAFRNKLIAAAERKDIKYVKGIMDPKIELSFGGDSPGSGGCGRKKLTSGQSFSP